MNVFGGKLSLRKLTTLVPKGGCILLFNARERERRAFAKNSMNSMHAISNYGVRHQPHEPRDYYITLWRDNNETT